MPLNHLENWKNVLVRAFVLVFKALLCFHLNFIYFLTKNLFHNAILVRDFETQFHFSLFYSFDIIQCFIWQNVYIEGQSYLRIDPANSIYTGYSQTVTMATPLYCVCFDSGPPSCDYFKDVDLCGVTRDGMYNYSI